jgi:hypothetical protein
MRVYDSKMVAVSFAGISIEGGFAEGSMVTVKPETARFKDVCGVDGEVTRSKQNDMRGTVELTLMQSSEANLLLSQRLALDLAAPGGAGVGALQIQDLSGGSLHHASEAWISEDPEAEYGPEAKERKWVIRCADLTSTHGGN